MEVAARLSTRTSPGCLVLEVSVHLQLPQRQPQPCQPQQHWRRQQSQEGGSKLSGQPPGAGPPPSGAATLWGRLTSMFQRGGAALTRHRRKRVEGAGGREQEAAAWGLRKTFKFEFKRVEGLPSSPAPSPAVPSAGEGQGAAAAAALAAAARLRGLWTAEYGSHGPEVLNLQTLRSGSPALEACPVKPPCLMGTKLVGDVNVPSGRLSFVANLQEFKLGRYDGRDVANQAWDFRPILSFAETGMSVVNLAARPVMARFAGMGQINAVPGQWSPSWEVIELIVYEDGQEEGHAANVFSVLWRDRGLHHAHIMDFMPFPMRPDMGTWAVAPGTHER
ncbi:hypothetical protein V8C86DRAFT_2644456 [Haematococcus lacustris]